METPKNVTTPPGSARNVERISKFLRIVSDAAMPHERGVMSNDNKLIAIIGYYKPWREWVLYPQPQTVWSAGCLAAIKNHLEGMGRITAEEAAKRIRKHYGASLAVLAD